MAEVLYDGLEICEDCLLLIANGEVVDGNRGDITDEVAQRQQETWGDLAVHLVPACPENCGGYFSMTRCDGCGDEHGGNRHFAAIVR